MNLILGDCLEQMAKIADKSIDLCLTDPPYGTTKEHWDIKPSQKYFNEIFRVSKNQIIFGGNWFNLPKKDGWIVWNKMPFLKTTNHCELLWTSFLKKNKVIDFLFAGNCVGTRTPDYKRPKVFFTSEKPMEFIKVLISTFAPNSKTILDPFMGTASTGVACKNLGIDFIGIEKDENHFNIAKQRCGVKPKAKWSEIP